MRKIGVDHNSHELCMNVSFVPQAAAEPAGNIFAVPKVGVDHNCGIGYEYCVICESVGDQ